MNVVQNLFVTREISGFGGFSFFLGSNRKVALGTGDGVENGGDGDDDGNGERSREETRACLSWMRWNKSSVSS